MEDAIPSDVIAPINRIAEETPLVKRTTPLLELIDHEIPGTTDVSDNGRLYTRYLEYTNLVADITDIYDKYMIINLQKLIKSTVIQVLPNVFIQFETVTQVPKVNRTPLKCRQLGLTYSAEVFLTPVKLTTSMVNNQSVVTRDNTTIPFSIGEIPICLGSSLCITKINKMSAYERFLIGECPDDPAGYCIIEGKEYFLPLQDKIRTNYPYTTYDDKYRIKMTCDNMIRPTSSVAIFKDIDDVYKITLISLAPAKTYVGKEINVLQLFRFFGMNNKQISDTILLFTKREWYNTVTNELLTSFNHLGLIHDDLEYFSNISKKFEDLKNNKPELTRAFQELISNELFTNYVYNKNNQTERNNFNSLKLSTLAMMISKLVETVVGHRPLDKRDSWSIKRIASLGMKMYQLFSSEWNTFINAINEDISKSKNIRATDSIEGILNKGKAKINLKNTYESAFKTNWGTNKYNKKSKQTDVLNRQSKLSPWAGIKRIVTSGSRENKKMDPREPQMGQWGFISMVDTPEGKEQCALTKNMAVTGWISTGNDETILFELLKELTKKGKVFPFGTSKEKNTILFINGKIMGQCVGNETRDFLVSRRRMLILQKDTSIVFDQNDNILYVYTDNGRICRPLLIVNPETRNLVIDEKKMWDNPIQELLSSGCMEYIDSLEQEYTYIAPNIETIRNRHKLVAEIEESIINLKESILKFEESGIIEYGVLQTERETRIRKKENVYNNIKRLNDTLEVHKTRLNNIKSEIHEETGTVERRLKFIDNNYLYVRETRVIKDLTDRLKIEEVKYNKLDNIEEVKVTKDYFQTQLDIGLDKYKKLKGKRVYTHCELHNSSIMSISESVIPLANRNPTTRVGFQCGMGRQALGIFNSNERFDTTTKMLVNPTAPIISGQNNKLIGLNKYGHGRNLIVAVMTYLGYNQEDAVIISKGFIARGGMRSKIMKGVSASIKRTSGIGFNESTFEDLTRTPPISAEKNIGVYRHLNSEGIARPESVIHTGDCLIGIKKTIKTATKVDTKDISVYATSEYEGYVVDRYLITNIKSGETTVKITLRDYRFPDIGDKFSSRIAQKSTIGTLMTEEDLPFTESGMRPDIIVSPMAFTSRMTGSYLFEMFFGKAALLSGRRILGGAFDTELTIEEFEKILIENGYQGQGEETLYSGVTGKPLKARIYMGPVYYHALKHQVKDKIQARQRGTRDQLTNQPIKGKTKGGGIKTGEMERDTFVAHGVPSVLQDISCVSSDAYNCILCQKCKNFFSVNFSIATRSFGCQICERSEDIVKVTIPFADVSLTGLISTSNMQLSLIVKRKDA